MDLTALSDTELNALDLEGPVVQGWLDQISDQTLDRDMTKNEERVWTVLMARYRKPGR